MSGMMGSGYDSGHGTSTSTSNMMGESNMGANDDACAICGYALRLQPMCSLPSCSHVFHSAVRQFIFIIIQFYIFFLISVRRSVVNNATSVPDVRRIRSASGGISRSVLVGVVCRLQ